VTTADRSRLSSEKDAKLAQKLGQLQPFLAVFRYSHRNARTNLHILGQPNTVLVSAGASAVLRGRPAARGRGGWRRPRRCAALQPRAGLRSRDFARRFDRGPRFGPPLAPCAISRLINFILNGSNFYSKLLSSEGGAALRLESHAADIARAQPARFG
jgi:hypothetical protein